MNPEDLRAFARRDFARIARAKREYWKREYDSRGPTPVLEVASALQAHVARYAQQDEGEARALDLAHHVRLKRRIDEASRAFRR